MIGHPLYLTFWKTVSSLAVFAGDHMADDTSRLNQVFSETSFLYGTNALYIEQIQEAWSKDPASVPPEWRAFFDQLRDAPQDVQKANDAASWGNPSEPPRDELISAMDGLWPVMATAALAKAETQIKQSQTDISPEALKAAARDSVRALMFIRAFRIRGHLQANLDPLGLTPKAHNSELTPEHWGFGPADMDRPIFIDNVMGIEYATMREIHELVKKTYAANVGVQYMHIADPAERLWIQNRIEGRDKEIAFTNEGKKAILKKLIETEGLERFLHRRFPGTKRFGIDGGEAMVPALEQIIKRGGHMGVKDIILGMPHRGRLNVLTAVMGKPYRALFHEFQGGSTVPLDIDSTGDVKYHMGASSDRSFDGNDVHLSLTANPSHLEIVNPVVLGKARAKQAFNIKKGTDTADSRHTALPLLLHGDAAFAGQGVVAECFALMGLNGYKTGGTVHFVVNNQIGFTTAPVDSRSGPYCSDLALSASALILHCNGDDPEAVVFCAKMATEFRHEFKKDVVIDMWCYRRFGHNEGDDPTFTQPLMYAKIKTHPSTRELYSQRLIQEGVISQAELDGYIAEVDAFLDAEFEAGKTYQATKADWLDGKWVGLGLPEEDERRGSTSVVQTRLSELGRIITNIPTTLDAHKTLRRVIEARRTSIDMGEGIDWALGEHLAFASLLDEGFDVRLSGQDSTRGTFSQRHSAFVDQTTEQKYIPLHQLGPKSGRFEVVDSALSEEAVLGFEYGYSLADPNSLVMWEGQFGDFVNGAQVVIDQFISSGERKWLRMSGLVMLLPHGYEGQGPEHSSARLERFLQMCAEDNMQVANCSTPANYFHILRRQIHRPFRKPLILMTPKSLLRHKKAISSLSEMTEGSSFHRILHDDAERKPQLAGLTLAPDDKIRRVILCSGKVYYDLLEEREKRGINDIYLMRLEQFYPWPMKSLLTELGRFKNAELIWCQEEPKNMGGWSFVEPWLELTLERIKVKAKRARYVGRPASASTAAGVMSRHLKELETFLNEALS